MERRSPAWPPRVASSANWRRVAYGLAFCWILPIFSVTSAEIRLKDEVRCQGSRVTLGDVAEISSSADGDELKKIVLFPAPRVGRSREVRQQEIRELLQLHGWSPLEHRWSGPSRVRIVGVRPGTRATVVDTAPVTPESGRLTPVAVRDLERGDLIREEDIRWEVSPRSGAPRLRPQELLGREVSRRIPAGQYLDQRSVRNALMVHRQDLVTVTSLAAGVQVQTQARATQDGAMGEVITLETLSDRQRYAGRVVGPGRIEVYADGTMVPRTEPPAIRERAGQTTIKLVDSPEGAATRLAR